VLDVLFDAESFDLIMKGKTVFTVRTMKRKNIFQNEISKSHGGVCIVKEP
jgi:hypothetical protein